jgi:hypothetical protein
MPSTSRDMAAVFKMGPRIVEGPTNAQGSKAKPASWVRAAQSNLKQHKGWPVSDTSGALSRGPEILKFCI